VLFGLFVYIAVALTKNNTVFYKVTVTCYLGKVNLNLKSLTIMVA